MGGEEGVRGKLGLPRGAALREGRGGQVWGARGDGREGKRG